jgi:hypothetical protein
MAKTKSPTAPPEPDPKDDQFAPSANWPHRALFERVKETLTALPVYFRTETVISGIMATDLHTLNTVLGATIEEQVVRTLNLLRRTWDPKDDYALYTFVRQPQTFPDVRLKRTSGSETIMGFDLKGWYLLAKEAEPSLRFTATAAACAPQDLVVVAPWALNNVISGSPLLFEPFIVSAKFAAAYRNYHWQHKRQTTSDATINSPANAKPYPSKSDQINDVPVSDSGGNFGRLARTGLLDAYRAKLDETTLCGIRGDHWRQFFKVFQEGTTDQEATKALEKLRTTVSQSTTIPAPKAESVLHILNELEALLKNEFPSA